MMKVATPAVSSSLLLLAAIALGAPPTAPAANPIQLENAKPGDSYWTAATQYPPSSAIAGYASATSVRPGQTIGFRVSTAPVARYRIEIDRLGWYGGSGGRRITCLVGAVVDTTCTRDEQGAYQPSPPPDPATGELDAGWSPTDTLAVPTDWTSGYYLAVFRVTSGPTAGQTGFTPFILQAPVGDRAAILVQVPSNTWQAYNLWGGEDLYSEPRAVKVSFNRPYAFEGPAGPAAGRGGGLFNWEYPLVRFLERGGWDVSYATDDDVDREPAILLDHRLDMTAGHDEYWTKGMRDGWEAARAAGVNLAFMGANTGFWQVRYENGDRTLVSYKYTPDPDPVPAEKTIEFRWLARARPECELEGVQYANTVTYQQDFEYTVDATAADPWFAGTGLSTGGPLAGLVGPETDELAPRCHVPPVTPLLHYSGPPPAAGQPPVVADSVRYTACSGAEVFSAGSLQFSWGLDAWRNPAYSAVGFPALPPASAALQAAMTRALGELTQSHLPVSGPPEICVPTSGFRASAPEPAAGQAVVFTSTAIDPYGRLAGQAWDLEGSGRFQGGTGRAAVRSFPSPGLFRVGLRATDSSGAASTTTKTLIVCHCPAAGNPRPWSASNCNGASFGTVKAVGGGVSFAPDPGIGRFTVRTYALALTASGAIQRRLLSSTSASGSTPMGVPPAGSPELIDLSTRIDGARVDQQFLLAAAPGPRSSAPGALAASSCDGARSSVRTALFGGSRAAPLRVTVSGRGRIVVSLAHPGRAALAHRVLRGRNRPVAVSFDARHLSPGAYDVTVSTRVKGHVERMVLMALG
ncbi:MAG: PKD domain-containing protein, partial [Solirubrobacterales bacterium]|nr:PKD domain-containing protein [Solirubrobacterales bacterium]